MSAFLTLQVSNDISSTCSLQEAVSFANFILALDDSDKKQKVEYILTCTAGNRYDGQFDVQCPQRIHPKTNEILKFATVGMWLHDFQQDPAGALARAKQMIAEHVVTDPR